MTHKSTQDLISQIERKDRRFRAAQSIFMSLLGIGILAVLLVQSQLISQAREQYAERQRDIIRLEQHNDYELGKQTGYIQCLAQFFATKDRASRILTNLNKCTITKDGTTINGVDLNPTFAPVDNSGSASPAPAKSSQSTTPPASTPPPGETKPSQPTPDVLKVITKPVCNLSAICLLQ